MPDRLLHELKQPRYELIPEIGDVEEQASHIPDGATVTITCPPADRGGIDATLGLFETLVASDRDINVVPHFAARALRSKQQFNEAWHQIDNRADEVFVVGGDTKPVDNRADEVFVVGGDTKPANDQPFNTSIALIKAIRNRSSDIEIGVTGYPEGHPDISDEVLRKDLLLKQQYNIGYVATQMCFEAKKITDWIDDMREEGMEAPVKVGVPGVVNTKKLIRIAGKIGVGNSLRLLQKFSPRDLIRLALTGQQKQTNLVYDLEPQLNDPDYNLDGFHIFSFNEIVDTEKWRLQAFEAHSRGERYHINKNLSEEARYWMRTKLDGLVSR